MTARYFVSLVLSVIVFVFTCIISGFSTNFMLFIDAPSALIVIVFPLIYMGILYGWKNIGSAFSTIFNKNMEKNVLLNAKTFFENYGKTVFSAGFIAFIIAFMAMMYNLEDKAALGPNMLVASFVLLYVGIINIAIIIPYKIIIKKKIVELEK